MNAIVLLSFLGALLFLNMVKSDSPEADQGPVGACLGGTPGIPGRPGHNGLPGRDGLRGERGGEGMKGSKGDRGKRGYKGENCYNHATNWKQCVWKRGDNTNTGLIQGCVFNKQNSATALKVAYAATMRAYCPSSGACCGRWYITFNGTECSGPMTIEGVVMLQNTSDNPHRHRQIEGFCENIPSGSITVAVHVGNCAGPWGSSSRHSGWNSVSRIMIEEYPESQV